MTRVAGVDGCRRGAWVAVVLGGERPVERVLLTFADVLALAPRPRVLAVDVPIGLLPGRRARLRDCDRAARGLLGPRRASVFPPPPRGLLRAGWPAARAGGLSKQAWYLAPRIAEVDEALRAKPDRRVREAHPELAFRLLAGRDLPPKRGEAGLRARLAALRSVPGAPRSLADLDRRRDVLGRGLVRRDDLLDAWVLAWTAGRVARREAIRLPARGFPAIVA